MQGEVEATIRDLPKNIEAEQIVLGSILLEPTAMIAELLPRLRPEMFYRRQHRVIARTILELAREGKEPDVILVANRIDERGENEKAGGRMYLNELLDRVTTTASAQHYLEIVEEDGLRRSLIEAGGRISELGWEESRGAAALLDQAQGLLSGLFGLSGDSGTVLMSDIADKALAELEETIDHGFAGVTSGFRGLDRALRGIRDGRTYIIGGRPANGKSELMVNMAYRQLGEVHIGTGKKALPGVVSLEMTSLQLMQRLIAYELRANPEETPQGSTKVSWKERVRAATLSSLRRGSIAINDKPFRTVEDVVRVAYDMVLRQGVTILYVDYIQLLSAVVAKDESREREVSAVSSRLTKLAKDLSIPIVFVAQLNRQVEARQEHLPRLGDLRESGALEQNADVVLGLVDPGQYDPSKAGNPLEVRILKNRHGPNGIVKLHWDKPAHRLDDVTFDEEPGGVLQGAARAVRNIFGENEG